MLTKLRGKAKAYELKAQQIRQFAGAKPFQRFDPYSLARQLKLIVISDAKDLGSQLNLSLTDAKNLIVDNPLGWSGGATPDRPDGSRVVILNPSHSKQRQAATLMEEICHILLGHEKSSITPNDEQFRDYNQRIEHEAYGVGAAVLLPYDDLLDCAEREWTQEQVARHFGVSKSLVRFRCEFLGLRSL